METESHNAAFIRIFTVSPTKAEKEKWTNYKGHYKRMETDSHNAAFHQDLHCFSDIKQKKQRKWTNTGRKVKQDWS